MIWFIISITVYIKSKFNVFLCLISSIIFAINSLIIGKSLLIYHITRL